MNSHTPYIPKNGGVFLGSLLFAFLLWFLFYLSKDFTKNILVPIKLIPKESSYHHNVLPVSYIQIRIRGRGWLISRYEKVKDKEPLLIRGNFEFKRSIKLRPYLAQLNLGLPSGLTVDEILIDSILLKKKQEFRKKVALHLEVQVNFLKQYYFSTPTRIYPDSIYINGPENLIKKINYWNLKNIHFSNVNKSIDTPIQLQDNRFSEISTNPLSAQIQIHVDRFTESSLSLPIKIIGNDEGKAISLIPTRVKISYLVPLSFYSTVREDLFETGVDLNDWKNNPQIGKLKIKLSRYPDFVRILKISPSQINFIIYP